MKQSFRTGLSQTSKINVDAARTIDFMGEDCRIYGTPEMIRDIEWTCRDLMFEHADPGEDSVGFKISVSHTAPTPLGMDVTITATVVEIDRNRVVLDISASDSVDTICTGQHERFFVNTENIKQRLLSKAEKASETESA
ncbi:MAG: thioesterase family protein [Hyphomicrobiales bacterium]|nr:thioesterase family protein [Hyphomicrobiales bacterium]MCP4998842.1 thioesterase family protein [Hyphomicrobiales bacterium]